MPRPRQLLGCSLRTLLQVQRKQRLWIAACAGIYQLFQIRKQHVGSFLSGALASSSGTSNSPNRMGG